VRPKAPAASARLAPARQPRLAGPVAPLGTEQMLKETVSHRADTR